MRAGEVDMCACSTNFAVISCHFPLHWPFFLLFMALSSRLISENVMLVANVRSISPKQLFGLSENGGMMR